jgi:ABC-type polysaccharide/polyol phosphate transport system ATPase subunit
MARDVVIRVDGLGKKYLIGHKSQQVGPSTLRESFARNIRHVTRSARDVLARRQMIAGDTIEEFWALDDVSFEVRRGEVVGVVGRNGAGKSTLLKILSRITDPTCGRVEMHGRVSSLLEVGTGFHQELTGRENVFLNGAILGMRRSEIRSKFDEIVAFSGIERFIDTPVKRYSSGMYARLAFAVAAHLDPEILIVDEVLAVGDAEFQQKCLGKMQSVAAHGRTVLFVSHSTAAVEQLCTRALYLESGRLVRDGDVQSVLSEYLGVEEGKVLEHIPGSDPSRAAEVKRMVLCGRNGVPLTEVDTAVTPSLQIELVVREPLPALKIAFSLHDSLQRPIFSSCPPDAGIPHPTQPGEYRFVAAFPGPVFLPQRYAITVSLYEQDAVIFHNCVQALRFEVSPGQSQVYLAEPSRTGVLQLLCRWSAERNEPQVGLERTTQNESHRPAIEAKVL